MQDRNIYYMNLAIKKAKEGIAKFQAPFGACIVKNDVILALEHNRVLNLVDITAHAEIVAIRVACKNVNNINLAGAEIYSTCEPCPMCFSACHWAKINKIVYGASIKDSKKAGFNELNLSNIFLKKNADLNIEIIGDILNDECKKLFDKWKALPEKIIY